MGIFQNIIDFVNGASIESAALKPYSGSLPTITIKKGSEGSDVKHLQKFLNWCLKIKLDIDGICGPKTVAAIKKFQKRYKLEVDGIFGPKSLAKAKSIVKAHAKPEKEPTLIDKLFDACIEQAKWAKHAKYKWQQDPTIAKSKKFQTCVTYVACVLQRIGLLKKGKFIWIDNNGKVFGATSKMTVTYLKGTLASNKDKLKAGDIVIGGNGKTGAGDGSHIFILTGKWKGDNPYIYDQDSANRVRQGKKPQHTWKGSFRTIARIRLK